MKRLEQRGVSICLDIYGNGELLEVCEEAAKCGAVSATVSVCGTLAYDASFFAAIRQYHAVVVPSLTEEQPRIVFDAFSQAVPCLASDTSGLRQCIDEGVNGRLTRAGDDVALADLLEWAARDRASLERMGINALAAARALTHRKMHSDRCAILVEKLAAFACPKT
jgi:glycosyltransferase involved in cell wall biosynthesis